MELYTYVFEQIVTKALDKIFGALTPDSFSKDALSPKLERHLIEVAQWAERIQFFGMASGINTKSKSIPLSISCVPRQFTSPRRDTDKLQEEELIERDQNYVVLGDPGSGKTTTLKRLVIRYLASESIWKKRYILVYRLREFSDEDRLLYTIPASMGISISTKDNTSERRQKQKYIGDDLIEIAVPRILDSLDCLILADGLDELDSKSRLDIERELCWLARSLTKAKLIVTCRSADYTAHMEGYEVVQIASLDEKQSGQIIDQWCEAPDRFRDALKVLPYTDVQDRPLFLTQLVVLFNNYGYLPEQPVDVYKKIVHLVLEEWDAQRRVRRRSHYAGFTPDKKADFLAAIAFELTYTIRAKRFSSVQLEHAYEKAHASFGLPKEEARKVVAEIESHTGLIFASGYDHYEFSHLSLQEYLCGSYLVRDPVGKSTIRYLQSYTAPIAVAIAMAANPSNWLALVLRAQLTWSEADYGTLTSLMGRLALEKPFFTSCSTLGSAFLNVYFSIANKASTEELDTFLSYVAEFPGLCASIAEALERFSVRTSSDNHHCTIAPHSEVPKEYENDVWPSGVALDKDKVVALARCCRVGTEQLPPQQLKRFVRLDRAAMVFE